MTDSEKVNQARLRNVWLGGHIDALQEAQVILDGASSLAEARDNVASRLILAKDTQRKLRERS